MFVVTAGAAHAGGRPSAPPGFFGVATPHVANASYNNRVRTFAALRNSGIETVSYVFDWAGIEPSHREFNFVYADHAVRSAASNGLSISATIFNAPDWALPPRRSRPGYYPPNSNAQFADFARHLARRYGPSGAFWTENPGVAKIPVRLWRIWNEPNLRNYWASGPNPKRYVRLLRAARNSIKAVDRSAIVTTGGIPNSRLGIPMDTFIKRIYKAGGRSALDGIALNPYATNHRGVIAAIRRTRATMSRYRHRSARIWITEFGWSDAGPPSPFFAGRSGQARQIGRTVDAVLKARAKFKVGGLIYFALRDQVVSEDDDWWGVHTGLFNVSGGAKPAWKALYTRARATRRVRGPSPDSVLTAIPGDNDYSPSDFTAATSSGDDR
ncbi:MAG: hypothetical protein WAO61_08720 [Solirubrobacterales bacterium]